ncbi:MAG: hypothetical protein JW969_17990 [Spirochaetales bacterium]|nr:hypothetical protein [Spirochaetales bacterium]
MRKRALRIIISVLLSMTLPGILLEALESNPPIGVWKLDRSLQDGRLLADKNESVWIEFVEDGSGRMVWEDFAVNRKINRFYWVLTEKGLQIIMQTHSPLPSRNPFIITYRDDNSRVTFKSIDFAFTVVSDPVELPPVEEDEFKNNMTEADLDFARRLVGTWRHYDPDRDDLFTDNSSLTSYYIFYEDYMLKYIIRYKKDYIIKKRAKWVVNDGVLSVFEGTDSKREIYYVDLTHNDKRLTIVELSTKFIYLRTDDLDM